MLVEQTMEKLVSMKLNGMAEALRRWMEQTKEKAMTPLDLAGLLVDAEWRDREQRKLTGRLRTARFRQDACVEDIDYQHPRGLQKAVMLDLASCRWVDAHQNVCLTGKTGVGKSYLACALGQKACREGYSVVYRRASRLYDELAQARADGTYFQVLRRLAKTEVLVIDDFGLEVLTASQRRDFLEVLEDRYANSSTIITSQFDPDHWHPILGEDTIADSVCDRIVHNAHKVKLGGESLRKSRSTLTNPQKPS
ncbi:MAG: IS21-like element helper ATPase IstB [Deltaproteobacteria bacterium]